MANTVTPFVSIGTVARRLGVSPTMIRRWELSGQIPPAARVEAGTIRRRVWTAQELAEMETTLAGRRVREGVSA